MQPSRTCELGGYPRGNMAKKPTEADKNAKLQARVAELEAEVKQMRTTHHKTGWSKLGLSELDED